MFLPYIHRFRGIAILFIISGHCIRFLNWENNPQVEKICNAALLNGAVLFVLIAGFLFQHLSPKYTYKTYILSKIKNIIIPYVLISIPMITYLVFFEGLGHWAYPGLNEKSYFFQILWYYVTGKHLTPLWFIPMISMFYMLYPIFIWIDRNEKSYYVILPLAIVISALVHRPPAEINVIHTFMYFFSVYLLGMWVSRYKDSILPVIDKFSPWLAISLIILFCIEVLFYDHTGNIYVKRILFHDKELININLFQKLLLCSLLLNFLNKFSYFFDRRFLDSILGTLAGLSIGIFFVHYYFLEVLVKSKRILGFEIHGNFFNLLLLSTLLAIACVGSLELSKFIFRKRSRYLIGC